MILWLRQPRPQQQVEKKLNKAARHWPYSLFPTPDQTGHHLSEVVCVVCLREPSLVKVCGSVDCRRPGALESADHGEPKLSERSGALVGGLIPLVFYVLQQPQSFGPSPQGLLGQS